MDKALLESFTLQAPKCVFSKEAVHTLEKSFNVTFPQEYTEFLLKYGSVVVEAGLPDSFKIKFEHEEKIGDILNILDSQEIIDSYNLLREDTVYGDEPQIPAYMIPIAHMNDTYYRNYILLNTKDNSIWSTEEEESIESEKDTYGFIAKGFGEFINSLEL
jgi:hypothetical protein